MANINSIGPATAMGIEANDVDADLAPKPIGAGDITDAAEVLNTMLQFGKDFDLGPTASQDLGPSQSVDKVLPRNLIERGDPEPLREPLFSEPSATADWLSPAGSSSVSVTASAESPTISFATAVSHGEMGELPR